MTSRGATIRARWAPVIFAVLGICAVNSTLLLVHFSTEQAVHASQTGGGCLPGQGSAGTPCPDPDCDENGPHCEGVPWGCSSDGVVELEGSDDDIIVCIGDTVNASVDNEDASSDPPTETRDCPMDCQKPDEQTQYPTPDCDITWTASGDFSDSGDHPANFEPENAGEGTLTFSANCSAGTCNPQVVPLQRNVKVIEVASLTPSPSGLSVDDPDQLQDDPEDTEVFAYTVGEGDIIVTATPNLDIDESQLPSCWSLTGGEDTDTPKLSRKVSREEPTFEIIHAEAGESAKRVKIYVIDVDIKYPNGDPSTTATNWNDEDSDEANWLNERTFSGGAGPGISTLAVPVQAIVEPEAAADFVGDMLRWEIDNVGALQAIWSVHVEGDQSTGKGVATAAAFTTPPSGLPANNSAFGTKEVRLSLEELEIEEATTIEVFYPRDANNHAGGQAGSPNWFHYWMQARPNPNVVYVNDPLNGAWLRVPAMSNWTYNAPGPGSKTRIEASNILPAAGRAYGVGKDLSGIDHLLGNVIHEEKHVQQIADADALMPATNGADSFRYGWSWNQGTHNHWNEGPDGEWGVAGVDDDGSGTVDDATPLPPFEPGWPGSDDVSLDHPNWVWWPNAWPLPAPFAGNPHLHPIEVEAIRHSDNGIDEHDYWEQDWGSPGKQHRTNQQWDD